MKTLSYILIGLIIIKLSQQYFIQPNERHLFYNSPDTKMGNHQAKQEDVIFNNAAQTAPITSTNNKEERILTNIEIITIIILILLIIKTSIIVFKKLIVKTIKKELNKTQTI